MAADLERGVFSGFNQASIFNLIEAPTITRFYFSDQMAQHLFFYDLIEFI